MVNPKLLSKKFLQDGYLKIRPKNQKILFEIQKIVSSKISKKKLNKKNIITILNNFHKVQDSSNLNESRLMIYNYINSKPAFSELYYDAVKEYLDILVGNELVMQNKINLSIQLPHDKSSILPMHSDTWSGDSPFEIVVWIPLVNCFKTKSMFILSPKDSQHFYNNYKQNSKKHDSKSLFNLYKNKFKWIDIKFGEILIFNQCLPHGNVENITSETRWSLNCRFKSLFSPYGTKKIGEFFKPINIKPASVIGFGYKDPLSE